MLHQDRDTMQPYLDTMSEQIDYFDDWFGAYPLDRYGIAITDSFPGLAMETMERPTFSRGDFSSGRLDTQQQLFLAHELAHQWFGDAVSPAEWNDVWLNESFATYGEWMWLDHLGLMPIESSANAGSRHESRIPRRIRPSTRCSRSTATTVARSSCTLSARRSATTSSSPCSVAGSPTTTARRARPKTSSKLANEVSGQDLTEFFATWLYADVLPTTFP